MASTSDWIIELEEHPYLDPRAIHVELAAAQGARSPDWLQQMLTPVAAPEIDDEVKKTVSLCCWPNRSRQRRRRAAKVAVWLRHALWYPGRAKACEGGETLGC